MSEPFMRDRPFTTEQVASFNRFSHFDADINKEFETDVRRKERETVNTLRRHGIKEVPQDVQKSLWYYRKALYDYYLESARARSIAPPASVIGPARYPVHRIPRSEKIHEKARSKVRTAEKYLNKSVRRHTKGKLELSEAEKWQPLASKAKNRVHFGKLYAEEIKKETKKIPQNKRTRWDKEVLSGNWDHVFRKKGRDLYDNLAVHKRRKSEKQSRHSRPRRGRKPKSKILSGLVR